MNVVHLFGNLGADPEVRYSASGNAVANLRLATTHRVKNGDSWEDATEWHKLVAFGRRAEVLGEHCTKGSKLCVRGQLRTRKWQDQSGQDRYTTEVVIDDFDFGGSAGGARQQNTGGFREKPAPQPQQGGFEDDDIPF